MPSTSTISGPRGDRSIRNQPTYSTPNATPSTSTISGPRGDRSIENRPTYSTPNTMPATSTISGPRGDRSIGNQPTNTTPNATPSTISGPRGERSEGNRDVVNQPIYSTPNATPSTIGGPRRAPSTSRSQPGTRSVSFSLDSEGMAAPQAQHAIRSAPFFFIARLACNLYMSADISPTSILRGALPRPSHNLPASPISPDTASFRRQQYVPWCTTCWY